MAIDPKQDRPTEVQIAARELADALLLAGGPKLRTVPKQEVTRAWMRLGDLEKATPSKLFPHAYGPGKAFNAAHAAIERMQLVDEGGALVIDVNKQLKRRGAKVGVIVADPADLPPNETGARHTNANFFMPTVDGAARYRICVAWMDIGPKVITTYELGLSEMADSIFHELLHIWFIHEYPTPAGETPALGHSGRRDEEVEFADRLQKFKAQMRELDKALKKRNVPR